LGGAWFVVYEPQEDAFLRLCFILPKINKIY